MVARRGCGVFHKTRGTCKRKRQAEYRIDGRSAMSAGCHQLTVRALPRRARGAHRLAGCRRRRFERAAAPSARRVRSGETHPALSSPTATSAFGLGGYASPSQCSCCKRTTNEVTPFICDFQGSEAMDIAEGVRHGSRARGEVLARRRRRRVACNQ